ncbi:MAG TPA: hypothetical protein DCE71_01580 [Parachlamydiales bacterium]|nr:hypothetical protein [Parachlamydiales bacterium]
MALSKSSKLFCPVRQKEVAANPEEIVRQRLLAHMIGPLGYPRGQIAVEKDFFSSGLQRRVDLVCFYPVKDFMKPLLLVECKAVSLTIAAENQLFGYNIQIGAPFLCLVNGVEIKMLWQEQNSMKSISFLPTYAQLIEKLC